MSDQDNKKNWVALVKQYQTPNTKKAIWQLVNTAVPYIVLFVAMAFAVRVSYWLMLPIAILTAGFQVRLFIIQHDCGHNSFFPSKKANNAVGGVLGVFTCTPYAYWRKTHAIHHATSGDLDFRGFGDVKTITVDEFYSSPWYKRLFYRAFRNPLFLFVLAPSLLFFIGHRYIFSILSIPKGWKRERRSLVWTDVGLAGFILVVGWIVGFKYFFMIYLTTVAIAATAGLWLFYVQHQFEETYWRWHEEWDYAMAALQGASFLKLPKVIQWFTGNIGFHHIHHLAPKIPNYLLEKAYKENDLFQKVTTLSMGSSLKTLFLHLWDEPSQRLVTFWKARRIYREQMSGA